MVINSCTKFGSITLTRMTPYELRLKGKPVCNLILELNLLPYPAILFGQVFFPFLTFE